MGFPTTPILDAFNRANEVLNTGNWSGPTQFNLFPLEILSNQAGYGPADNIGGSYWSARPFSSIPGVEVHCDLASVNGTDRFLLEICIANPNSGSENFYSLQVNRATNLWRLTRIDAGVSQTIHADVTQAVSNGDGAGLRKIGDVIEVWYRTGGVWSQLFTQSDSAYTSGFIGVEVFNSNLVDNFGGGNTTTQPSGGNIGITGNAPTRVVGTILTPATP